MKVKEYLKFAAGIKGVKGSERKAQIEDVMEKLKIKDMETGLSVIYPKAISKEWALLRLFWEIRNISFLTSRRSDWIPVR